MVIYNKFKVGDKVRLIEYPTWWYNKIGINEEFEIISTYNDQGMFYIEGINKGYGDVEERHIELWSNTYKDVWSKPFDEYSQTDFSPNNEGLVKSCNHENKYKNVISANLKFWYCPDCKTDLGDI